MKKIINILIFVILSSLAFSQTNPGQNIEAKTIKLNGLIYNTNSGGIDTLIFPHADSLGQFKVKNVSDPYDLLDAVNYRTLLGLSLFDSVDYNINENGYLRYLNNSIVTDSLFLGDENIYINQQGELVYLGTISKHFANTSQPYISYGGDITDNLNGTITIDSCEASIKISDNINAEFIAIKVPDTTLTITANQNIILYIDYNSGSPRYTQMQSVAGYFYQHWDKIPFATCINIGSRIIVNDFKDAPINGIYKNILSQLNYQPIRYLGGLTASEAGTRQLSVSAGAVLRGNDYASIASINTSTVDTFTRMYVTSGTWTRTTGETTVSNSEYNDISTGLVTLTATPERWANKWLFYILDNPSFWILLEGQTAYTSLAAAEAGGIPSVLPPEVNAFYAGALLVAKIIVSGNETNIVEVQNPFTTTFQTSAAASHSNLSDLYGNTPYYHLGTNEYLYLTDTIPDSLAYHTAQINILLDSIDSLRTDLSGITYHDAVTLAGTPDYITISGQQITRNQIDLTSDVTGVLPDGNVANNITLDNITQITNRSHTNLTDKGTNTHATIDSHLASTANPHNTKILNLGDVTISSIASGEMLKYNGSGWVNNTLSEAGIQPTITGAATTVTSSDLTANRALISNASGKIAVSSILNTNDAAFGLNTNTYNSIFNITGNISLYGPRSTYISSNGTTAATAKTRFGDLIASGYSYASSNISYNGSTWNLDNTSVQGTIWNADGNYSFRVRYATAGTNPRTPSNLLLLDYSGNLTASGKGTGSANATGGYDWITWNQFDSKVASNSAVAANTGKDTTGIFHINRALLDDISSADTARWGSGGTFTESDPIFTGHTTYNIANGTGFLKNNGSGTWSYDNTTYNSGSGTSTYIPKFTGANTIGNSPANVLGTDTIQIESNIKLKKGTRYLNINASPSGNYHEFTGINTAAGYKFNNNAGDLMHVTSVGNFLVSGKGTGGTNGVSGYDWATMNNLSDSTQYLKGLLENADLQDLGFNSSTGAITITSGTGTTIGGFSTSGTDYGFVKGSSGKDSTYFLSANGEFIKVGSAGTVDNELFTGIVTDRNINVDSSFTATNKATIQVLPDSEIPLGDTITLSFQGGTQRNIYNTLSYSPGYVLSLMYLDGQWFKTSSIKTESEVEGVNTGDQGINEVLAIDNVSTYDLEVPEESYSVYNYYEDASVVTKKDFRDKMLSMPQDYDAGLVIEKSADMITTPHGTCMKGDVIFVGNRSGTATIVRFNDPTDLTDYDTQSFVGYDRLECLVYNDTNDMIYGTLRSGSDNYVRVLEIDPDAFGTYTIHSTTVYGASTPAIATDDSYVYVGGYNPNPRIYKISVSTWTAADSTILPGWTAVHGAAISPNRGEVYFSGGGGTDSIAIIKTADMSHTSVYVGDYVDSPTDDIAYYENETDTLLFIQGESPPDILTGGVFSGAKIDLTDNSVSQMPFYPGYGVFINGNLMTVANDLYTNDYNNNGIQIFSLENINAISDFTKYSLADYQPNEIFITSNGLLLFTDFETNNGVLFRLNSDMIPSDAYIPVAGVASVTAGDAMINSGTAANPILDVNLGTLGNDATATTSDYIPWIDLTTGDQKMTIATLAALVAGGSGSQWTTDTYGITYGSGNVGVGIASNSGIGFYTSRSLASGVAGQFTNTSSTGNGLFVQTAATTSSYNVADFYNGAGSKFKIRADGQIFAPSISNTSQSYVLGYDAVTGQITYFTTPSGGSGTVTSVGISGSDFSITGSPVTTSGTIGLSIANGVVGANELASTAVTPGSYTTANITVDADGRITAASNGSGSAVSLGTDNQIPVMNAAGTDFEYSSDFTWNGTSLISPNVLATSGILGVENYGGTPGTPSGTLGYYYQNSGIPYFKNYSGTNYRLISADMTAGRIQVGNTTSITGYSGFTYSSGTGTMASSKVSVDTEAYTHAGWDNDYTVPTKDALDEIIVLRAYSGVRAYASAGLDVDSPADSIAFLTESYDTDNYHSTNSSRFYVPTDGIYTITVSGRAESTGTGTTLNVGFYINGASLRTLEEDGSWSNSTHSFSYTETFYLNSGDYIQIYLGGSSTFSIGSSESVAFTTSITRN